MKKIKQIVSVVLCLLMLVAVVPVMEAFAYDVTSAISYADDNWDKNGGQLCAEFVARCLAAGGISIPNKSCYSSTTKSYQNNSGELGAYTNPFIASAAQLLYLANQGYQVITDPSNSQFSLGDVAFMPNTNGSKDGHVGIITDFKDGIPCYSAHNKARNRAKLYGCTYLVKMNGTISPVNHTVNTSYARNYMAYLIDPNSNHYVYDANHNTTGGYVNDTDPCTIIEVYTDGCCKFSYVLSSGGTKTAYGKISWFKSVKPTAVLTADEVCCDNKTNVYFGFSGENTTGVYTLGIYKDGKRLKGFNVTGNSYHEVFSEPGNYKAYMTSYNSSGDYADSNWVYWKVYNKTTADLSVDKSRTIVGKPVTFTIGGDNCGKYTIAIYKDGARVLQKTVDEYSLKKLTHTYSYSATQPGSYSAYITAFSLHIDSADSKYVYWDVYDVPSKPMVTTIKGNLDGSVSLRWTPCPVNTINYSIRFYQSGSTAEYKLLNRVTNQTSYTYYGLPAGKYCATVTAEGTGGWTMSDKTGDFEISTPTALATSTYNGHTYTLYQASSTWIDAQLWCMKNGGHLVTITDSKEQNTVNSLIGSRSSTAFWLGAEKLTTGNFRWVTGENWNYANWTAGQPNDEGGIEHYLGTYQGTTWNDYRNESSTPKGFIFEKDGADSTPFIPVKVGEVADGDHSYTLYLGKSTWSDAKAWCENHGGYLATITSDQEQAVVKSVIGNYAFGNYWLGAENESTGKYHWITCEPMEYTNWGADQPSNDGGIEHYLGTYHGTTWNDYADQSVTPNGFIMETGATNVTHTWNSGTVIKEATANEEGIIRYTCITCGATKDVSVAALQPTGITADLTYVKKSYYVGEALDTSDLELSATYSDGTTETVTEGFTCTPSELTTPGKQTVTVNYSGKTCTYEVNVKVEEPAPYWGDMNGDKRIDDSDARLVNQYLKGYVELSDEQKCFADVIFDGRVNASDYTKMLRYAKGYEADPISSTPVIRLTTSKSSYNTGDTLESEKFQIVVSSTEGSAVSYTIADGFVLSGYDANKTGTQTISTTFRGLELSTTITVAKAEHTHNYTSSITKPATCSATGIRTFTCSCGDSYTETVPINPSNHVNKTNTAATASTCTVKGYTAGVYCNDCKKYVGGHEEQPLAAHQTTTQNAKTATCTAEGYTGDQVCTVCKQTITKGTAIAKKSHTLTTINKSNPGCTTAGYTGDQYCTTCKQTVTKGSAISALGHANADSNGNCTRCGTHIKDVTPSQPSNPQPNPNACKYCGQVHSGPFGWLIKFFHSILAIFKR